MLAKNGDTLGNIVSKLTVPEVDGDKIVEQIGVVKIGELTAIPTDDDGVEEANSVDEEGCSSVDEVVVTSTDDTWS